MSTCLVWCDSPIRESSSSSAVPHFAAVPRYAIRVGFVPCWPCVAYPSIPVRPSRSACASDTWARGRYELTTPHPACTFPCYPAEQAGVTAYLNLPLAFEEENHSETLARESVYTCICAEVSNAEAYFCRIGATTSVTNWSTCCGSADKLRHIHDTLQIDASK